MSPKDLRDFYWKISLKTQSTKSHAHLMSSKIFYMKLAQPGYGRNTNPWRNIQGWSLVFERYLYYTTSSLLASVLYNT